MISDSFVKKLLDTMRKDKGLGGNMQRLEQLAWLMFLKVLDSREDQLKLVDAGYMPLTPENLRWKNWAADDEGLTGDSLLDFVNDELFPGLVMAAKSRADHRLSDVMLLVAGEMTNFSKSGTNLRQVINQINSISLHTSTGRHSFNDIYEKILKQLQSAKDSGEYYTPRSLTEFIVQMTGPKLGDVILDPACGTGGFLVNAINYLREKAKTGEDELLIQKSLRGYEVKQLPHILCVTNMLSHDIDDPDFIKHDNTLSRPVRDYGPADKVDIILANPPFGGEEELGIEKNFPASYQTRETADLFMYLFIHLLKSGGRAGVILPDSFLSGDGVKARIKEKLLSECNLHTVVRLPGGEFTPYAAPKVCMLFFDKGTPTKNVWFYELPLPEDVGTNGFTKTKPIERRHMDVVAQWWKNRKANDNAWQVSIEDIKKRDWSLHFANPSKPNNNEPENVDEIIDELTGLEANISANLSKLKSLLGHK